MGLAARLFTGEAVRKMEFKNSSERGKTTVISIRCPNWLFGLIEKQVALTGQTKTDVVVSALGVLLAPDDGGNSEWTQEMIDDYVAICDWDDRQDLKRQQVDAKLECHAENVTDDIKTWEKKFRQRWFNQ